VRLDDRVTIATPEGVTIDLVLAGLGSRFIARLLDSLIQAVVIFALMIGVFATSAPGSVRAVAIVITFLVVFAYDVPFELFNQGRTPGKTAAGIRVVGLDGGPVRFLSSAIRNILRIVDFLPALYLVGASSIVATEHDQRLGDLAAGTIVTRDRFPGIGVDFAAPLTVPPAAVTTWDVSGIQPDELQVVRHFLDRRLSLAWPVRMYFASSIASRLSSKVAGAPYGVHPEYLLEGIVVAKQSRL
jgi:uncharacterized RDD family membrane protein YckC